MLSRNNNKLLIHKLEPKKQRFAIRKISVGVASVLIGFTFAGFSGVSADEATTTTKDHLKTEATAESSSVPTKEVELTSSDETQAKEAEQTSSVETSAKETETTPVADDKAQVAEDTKAQAPAQAVTAEETSEPTTSTEKQTVAPADENEASETQTFNVKKQAEPQANVDLTDSKVAYAAAPTQAQDQQEEGFSVTDPDYSKYAYGETNLQALIDGLGIDYKNSEYVFQWIASTDWERGIIFTVDRGRDADGNVILTGNGSFNAYEYSFLDEYHITKAKTVIQKGQQTLNFGQVINDESKDAIAVDHFYSKIEGGFFYRTQKSYLPIFVGGHSGIESNKGNGYTTLSIYTPQVVEQKAKINNGKVYKTQTGLTGQNYTTGVPKSAKVEEGKFLYAENSEGTMSEFHKGVVLVNNYHDGVTVRYTELDNQGTMQYEFLDNRGFAKKLYNESTRRNESRGILHVGQSFTYEGDSAKYHISNPYVQQTTDITYEYRTLGSVELYDENGNCLGKKQYVNDENDAAKASLPEVLEEFPQGDIEYTLVAKEDLPSDLSRSIKYIYRGIKTKVTNDTYTLTTKFVDESGNELKAAEPQTITWTTTTKRDIHTNEITEQTFVPSKTSYAAVNSPVIAGYYATTPGLGSRKAEQKNATQKIVYRKLGNIIAKDSQGNDLTKVPYENDANDATKIKEIVAPTIEGYHVKSEVVQPSDPGQNTVLNYGNDTQVAQIKYWDETAHKYITDDQGNDLETTETGAHNTKISHKKVAEQIHALKAKGYEYDFANQEFSTVYFDDDDSKPQTFTVKLMHGTTTKPESKQITREIHIHHPNQEKKVISQTATLTRNVTRDKVTGDVIETGEWNPGNFDEVEVTPHKGYKIDETPAEIQNGKVVGKTVKPDEEDGKKIDVKYIPLEQHALVKYVDDNTGALLDEEDIQGVTDAAIEHSNTEKITAYQANGYELVSDELADANDPHFNAEDEPQVFEVHLRHRVEKVTNAAELEKTVTRTIIAEVPNGKHEETQTVKFTRTGTKDLVTGDIAWNDWSPAQEFEAYTAPIVPGYTPSKATVERATVTADDKDTTITITYTANDQKVMIKYVDVDNNNEEVKSQSLDGVTDQTVDTKYEVPANYELVAGQDLPKTVTFKANGNEPIIVKVQHKKVTVSVGEQETQNVVTRKITVHKPDGTTEDVSQTAKFTRTGTKDLVTGKIAWNAWSPAQKLDAYTAPKVDGYTADKKVDQLTVNANDKIAPVDIYYTADAQEVMIKYIDVDENDNEVKRQSVSGKTDQTVDVNYEVPANYEEVADQDLPGKVTFKADGNEPIIVKVQHKKVSVKVGEKGTQNVVTRKITVHKPDGTTEDISQTATFTRTGTKDLVTGKTTWNAWSPAQEFAAYTAPKVDGYTADKTVDRLTVNANDKIAPVDIYYTANDQKVMVQYVDVDDNNKEVASQSVSGKTDQTVDVNYEVPANYEEVADQDLPGKVTFKANGNEPIIVKVQHKTTPVKVGEQETQNVVTRKITVHMPDGTTQDVSQTATFTRTGTKDLVTGKIAWNAWSPAQKLDAYTAPKVDGYTADKTVEQLTVNANDKIAPVDIYYTADAQEVMIKYIDVDENDKEVNSQPLDGVTDQTVDVNYEVPANYELVADQDLPKTVTFKANGNEPIIVKVQHKHQDVTDEYKNDAHKQDKVDHTVTRIITIEHPHATDETHTQSLHFTRQVTRDMATGQDTFGEWIPDTVDFFEGFAIEPKASDKGYTHDKTSVDRLEHITGDTKDPNETVGYTANTQKAHVHYIDDTTGEKLADVHVTGKTDEPIKHDSKAKVQDYLNKGYELVSDDFAKAGKPSYNAEDEDQHFEVHLKHAIKDVTDQHAEHEVKHTVNRHIIIKHPHAADETHTQSIHFKRQVTRDMTTGQDTFGEWIPENADFFEEFAVPTLASDKGYTPKKTKVDRLEHITGDTGDKREIVEFAANDQKAHVHYIDDTTGKKLEVVHVTGKTDEPIKHDSKAKVQDYLNKGYELVSDDFAKAGKPSYNAEDEDQHFEVHLKHAIKDVTDQHAEHEVKHTVNRHIIIKHPHAADETHTQSIHFKRQVTRDMTTGQDTFGEWIPENADFFEEFAVPTLASDKGYTPKKTKVDRLEHITGDTGDKREIVEFTANDQKAHVHYIDDTTGKKLEVVHVTGKTDEPIKHDSKAKVQAYLDKGYELVSDDFAKAGKPSYNAEDEEQHFEVHLKHGQKDVTDEYKQDDKRKDHVDRTIKREIIINHPKEDPESYVQTAHFTRNVTRDTVTGEDKPGEWIPEENDFFEEVPVSLKDSDKGYTPEKTKVDRLENISADTPNQKEVVEFTPNEQHALVKYVDDSTGTLLDEEDIQGVTDAAIEHTNDEKIAAYQAKGYELVSDELADENDPHFNAEDEAQVYTVHLKHGSKVVKADPSNADSQKEVKRTIIVNAPDGTKTTKVQTVVFTRDGSKDLVTGKISYPDWNEIATKAFSQDDVPQYLGYTSMVAGRKQTTIAAQNVRPTDADQVIEVSYVARPSQQVITYQDENGNQIGTQVITGHTDETVKLVPVLPDGWELLDPDSLPENVTFAPEENPVLVITVKRTVTENSAKTEKDVENTEVAKQEVVNDTTDVTTDEKNEATLPQMGESDSETLAFSLLGLVTAAFSLFYFGKERRKTDN